MPPHISTFALSSGILVAGLLTADCLAAQNLPGPCLTNQRTELPAPPAGWLEATRLSLPQLLLTLDSLPLDQVGGPTIQRGRANLDDYFRRDSLSLAWNLAELITRVPFVDVRHAYQASELYREYAQPAGPLLSRARVNEVLPEHWDLVLRAIRGPLPRAEEGEVREFACAAVTLLRGFWEADSLERFYFLRAQIAVGQGLALARELLPSEDQQWLDPLLKRINDGPGP